VSDLRLLLAFIPVLLLCAFTLRQVCTACARDAPLGLARIGYGLAKLCLLALPLEWLVHLSVNAVPVAVSAKTLWLGSLAFTCQLCLLLSGAADVIIGAGLLFGRAWAEPDDAPFRAGSFTGLWQKWHLWAARAGPAVGTSVVRHAVLSLLLVCATACLLRGVSLAVLAWAGLHGLLIMAERWRGRSLFAPLPLPLRVILVLLVLVVSNALLLAPGLVQAGLNLRLMFAGSAPNLYSLLHVARFTSGWLPLVLNVSLLVCIAMPTLAWFLRQQRVWRVLGILLCPLSLLMLLRQAPAPAALRHLAQWPVTWLFNEGNARVFAGHEGWLYPMSELDRRTLLRSQPGSAEALISAAAGLKQHGIPLLVISFPAKAALYPEHILRAEYSAPVQPPGQKAVLERLRSAGIEVLDPADHLWSVQNKTPGYFQTDSRWTPEAMKEVARLAAAHIRKIWPVLFLAETPIIQATILDRTDVGDLARALIPWQPQSLFGTVEAQLVSIRGLESTSMSPILLLGGGLLDIYHDPAVGFGGGSAQPMSAGFATQLAALLGRPLETRTLPETDPGALLGNLASTANDNLGGKKLVICLLPADSL